MNQPVTPTKKTFAALRGFRILIPVGIGLLAVAWMFYREFRPESLSLVTIGISTVFWLFLALCMMVFRDLGYIWRLQTLTDRAVSWRQSLRVILLWEFSSAVLPSAGAGSTVAMIYLNKEGVSFGKSSAVVLTTSFLDAVYFALMFPILLLLLGHNSLFGGLEAKGSLSVLSGLYYLVLLGYSMKFVYSLVMFYALFFNPQGIKWIIVSVFKLKFLRRWSEKADEVGDELVIASNEFKRKPFLFWLKAFGATSFSWTARYLVVNCMILAFFAVHSHLLLFARQLIMLFIMMVSPSPGGSGFAEFVFGNYLTDFVPDVGIIPALALFWRLITYYPYIIVGALLFPAWLKRKFVD